MRRRGGSAPAISSASTGTDRLSSASATGRARGAARRAHAADRAARRAAPGPRHGQLLVARVEVQQHHPARRPPEVRDPGDRLLPAVAALGQVHRRADPADLVRDRASSVSRPAAVAGRHPQRLERHPAGRAPAAASRCHQAPCRHGAPGDRPTPPGPRHPPHQAAARERARRARAAARRRPPAPPACPGRRRSAPPAPRWRRGVHVGPELHLAPGRPAAARRPARCPARPSPDMRDDRVVLHPAVAVEHQRLGPGTVGQLADVLGEQQVQPGQPVGAGHGQHPRCERSTTAAVRAMARCSASGSPRWAGTASSRRWSGRVIGCPGSTGVRSVAGLPGACAVRAVPDSATCVASSWKPDPSGSRSARPVMRSERRPRPRTRSSGRPGARARARAPSSSAHRGPGGCD